jgi:hypothetical protein
VIAANIGARGGTPDVGKGVFGRVPPQKVERRPRPEAVDKRGGKERGWLTSEVREDLAQDLGKR